MGMCSDTILLKQQQRGQAGCVVMRQAATAAALWRELQCSQTDWVAAEFTQEALQPSKLLASEPATQHIAVTLQTSNTQASTWCSRSSQQVQSAGLVSTGTPGAIGCQIPTSGNSSGSAQLKSTPLSAGTYA